MQKAETKPIVVVVNDEPVQLKLVSAIIRRGDMEPLPFSSAAEALAAMAGSPPPALVITDLHMPEIDGWRFCRLLKSPEYAAFNDVPILAVSAMYEGEEPGRLSIEAGAAEFLPMPISAESLLRTARSLIESSHVRRKRRALIIEDMGGFLAVVRACFERSGYEVRAASDICEARRVFTEAKFDIAIIDYHLPDGGGDCLLGEFQKKQPDCVCIMVTGDPTPELALDFIRKGAAAYLRKPFELDYLLLVCARAMRERAFLRVEQMLDERTRAHRKQQEKHLILINNTPDFIYSLDLEGRHTAVNRSVCNAMKLPLDKIVGKNHIELGFPEETAKEWRALHEKVFSTRKPVTAETSATMPDGQVHIYEVRLFPIINDDGLIEGLSGVSRDITESKRAEQKLRAAERSYHELIQRERRRLSADLHDTVCQQIAGIGFISKRIKGTAAQTSPAIAEMASEISGIAGECSEMIRSVARELKPLADEPGALQAALRDLSVWIGRVFGKHCVCRLDESLSLGAPGVAGELFLIAREAALNAAKHSNGDGIEVDLKRDGDMVTLTVADNGTGAVLPPAPQDAAKGLGIMRLRAETIDAELSVERAPGGGVLVVCRRRGSGEGVRR